MKVVIIKGGVTNKHVVWQFMVFLLGNLGNIVQTICYTFIGLLCPFYVWMLFEIRLIYVKGKLIN